VLFRSLQSPKSAWQLGFRCDGRDGEIETLLKGGDPVDVAPKIRYVVHGKDQCKEMRFNSSNPAGWEVAFQAGNYTVFKRNVG
jgi:hypothetical protein